MRLTTKLLSLAALAALFVTTTPNLIWAKESRNTPEANKLFELQVKELEESIHRDSSQEDSNILNQAHELVEQAETYFESENYDQALSLYQQALPIFQQFNETESELSTLLSISHSYLVLEEYSTAIDWYQKSFESLQRLRSEYEDKQDLSLYAVFDSTEALIHQSIGHAYILLEEYSAAIDWYRNSLQIYRNVNARGEEEITLEGVTLRSLGDAYAHLENYAVALGHYKEALPLFQEFGLRGWEAGTLERIGIVHHNAGEYTLATDFYEQAILIYQELERKDWAVDSLVSLSNAYLASGETQRSIEAAEQGLLTAREIDNQSLEGYALLALGKAYIAGSGNYNLGIEFTEEALVIAQQVDKPNIAMSALVNLSFANVHLGNYEKTLSLFEEAVEIAESIDGENIDASRYIPAYAHVFLGNYADAIEASEVALTAARKNRDSGVNSHRSESHSLGIMGLAYLYLGNYEEAIHLAEQSLAVAQAHEDRVVESNPLFAMGSAYIHLNQPQKGIELVEQSIQIADEFKVPQIKVWGLVTLGMGYAAVERYQDAVDISLEALAVARELGDKQSEADTLRVLGYVAGIRGDYLQALEYYRQALPLFREVGDRNSEGLLLGHMGRLLAERNQAELATVFLKSSVNARESIRDDIQGLSVELQQSFTDTIADDYRLLADLLLEQGRIPEAQQVLDLLKLEELREFTDTTRATWNGDSLAYTKGEAAVFDSYNELIEFGQRLYECQQSGCEDLSALLIEQQPLIAAYNDQVAEFEVTVRDRSAADPELFTNPDNLSGKAQELLAANPNSVLIYPFVTDDKLWLLWATPGAVGSVAIEDVDQGEISGTVQQFGDLLTRRGDYTELQTTSQQLYNWLVEPLEEALQANDIEHLIFVHDRVTRYIPMAALFDGERFLMERYTLSTVIAPEITDTRDRLTSVDESQVLGLGLSQPIRSFNALPAVEPELNNIILSGADDDTGIYPGEVHLNEAFTLEQLQASVLNHRVLHIASHAKFEPVRKEESFIVLGNGDELRVTDIDNLHSWLGNLHLVVLSACQTALGGTDDGDGTEIAGIASYFLKEGRAEAVLASLWAVNDRSTSILMQRFYELLASGELTKAEALRQAQLSLFYDEDTETRLAASRSPGARPTPREGVEVAVAEPGYRHPYYWAPFILIGNGL